MFQNDENLTTVAALEVAIEQVKSMVLETDGVSDERKRLVKRLIELRLKLQDVKEVTSDLPSSDPDYLRIVNSHQFILQKQPLHRSAQYCDKCSGVIWTIFQSWYRCKGIFSQYFKVAFRNRGFMVYYVFRVLLPVSC